MKYIIIPVLLLFFGCQVQTGDGTWPEDLPGKKTLLQTKRTELKALEADIKKLKAEIATLDPSTREKVKRTVVVDTVKVETVQRFVEIQSAVEAEDAVMASSEMGGRITQMNVVEGQAVRKGQLIASVDVESINKQIAELETSLELARDVFDRQSKLWEQNIGSEIQYLQAKNNKERLEKSLETARYQLTKANVHAPISGVIDDVIAKAGMITGPGTPVAQIMNTYQVKVVAAVPEKYLPVIKRGQQVTLKFPAIDVEKNAKVSTIGRTVNPANRTFEVEVLMSNPKGLFKPNLLALMAFKDFEAKDVVAIPLALVQQEITGENYVFIQTQNGKEAIAQKVYVETGERSDGDIIIAKGLNGGEMLIVDGARGLADGEEVVVSN